MLAEVIVSKVVRIVHSTLPIKTDAITSIGVGVLKEMMKAM
jgi:hypothetical protein